MENQIDWTKPVRLKKSKLPIRVLATDRPNYRTSIVCMDGGGVIWNIDRDGRDKRGTLIVENVPERVSLGWVNIYGGRHAWGDFGGSMWRSRAEALLNAGWAGRGPKPDSVAELYRDEDDILRIEEHALR